MALLTEALLVSGLALDLVGAKVLSHAANAESTVELREEVGEERAAVGELDAVSTHAPLLAEKRIGLLLLTIGLVRYLTALALKSSEGPLTMGVITGGVGVWAGRQPGVHPGGRQPGPCSYPPGRAAPRPSALPSSDLQAPCVGIRADPIGIGHQSHEPPEGVTR